MEPYQMKYHHDLFSSSLPRSTCFILLRHGHIYTNYLWLVMFELPNGDDKIPCWRGFQEIIQYFLVCSHLLTWWWSSTFNIWCTCFTHAPLSPWLTFPHTHHNPNPPWKHTWGIIIYLTNPNTARFSGNSSKSPMHVTSTLIPHPKNEWGPFHDPWYRTPPPSLNRETPCSTTPFRGWPFRVGVSVLQVQRIETIKSRWRLGHLRHLWKCCSQRSHRK